MEKDAKNSELDDRKPTYKWSKGSIRVSGKSQVFKTGLSAFHEWRRGTRPVEFVFLGGNAGHQCFKACIVAKREIEAVCKTRITFEPIWSTDLTDPLNGQPGQVKDISIWRIIDLGPIEEKNNEQIKGKS